MSDILRVIVSFALASAVLLAASGAHAQFRQVTSSATDTTLTDIVDDRVLFSTNNGLWATDGAASVKLVPTLITIQSNGPASHGVGVVGGAYVFSTGQDLYATKGTLATTVLLSNGTVAQRARGGNSDDIQVFGGTQAYFNTSRGEAWTTNGTPAGTKKIASLGTFEEGYYGISFLRAGSKDLFTTSIDDKGSSSTGVDNPANDGLWLASASSASRIVAGHSVGRASCGPHAYFQTSAGAWSTDGTAAGTIQISSAQTFIMQAWCLGSTLVAQTSTDALFVSEGTAARSKTLAQGLSNLEVSGKYAYFITAEANARTLWRTDGTAAGTIQLALLSTTDPYVRSIISFGGGRALVQSQAGFVLTDGTVANTKSVTSTMRFIGSGLLGSDGRGYFFATDTGLGREPWVTDFTTAGTKLLEDVAPGTKDSADSNGTFVERDGEIFAALRGASGPKQIRALRIKASAPKPPTADGGTDDASTEGGTTKEGAGADDGGAGADDDSATTTTTTTTTSGCGVAKRDAGQSWSFFGVLIALGAAGCARRRP